jgi:CheY-like chemotaxis protein
MTEKTIKILVVDDEQPIADTLALILQRAGYEAHAVYNGDDAMSFVTESRPNAVISDVMMPGLNGVELAIEIRNKCPECMVMLVSGNANTQDLLEEAREQGHTFEVLAKPIPPRQLLSRLIVLLDGAQLRHCARPIVR